MIEVPSGSLVAPFVTDAQNIDDISVSIAESSHGVPPSTLL